MSPNRAQHWVNRGDANPMDPLNLALGIWLTAACIERLCGQVNHEEQARRKSADDEQQATAGLGYEWHGTNSDGYQVMQAEPGHAIPTPPHRPARSGHVPCRVIAQHGITCLWQDRERFGPKTIENAGRAG